MNSGNLNQALKQLSIAFFMLSPVAAQDTNEPRNLDSAQLGSSIDATPPSAFVVAKELLSSQHNHPFLFLGKPMDPSQPRWDEYAEAIQRFQSAEACLIAPPEGSEWNLAAVDWTAMHSHKDIEVCFFRIFDTLNDPERVRRWLEHQGYWTTEMQPPYESNPSVRFPLEPIYRFAGLIATNELEARMSFDNGGVLGFLLGLVLPAPKGYTVNLSFSADLQIVSVFSGSQGR